MAEVTELEAFRPAPEDEAPGRIFTRYHFEPETLYLGDAPETFFLTYGGGELDGERRKSSLGPPFPMEAGDRVLLAAYFYQEPQEHSWASDAMPYYLALMPDTLPVDITAEEAEDIYTEHCDPEAPADLNPTAPYHGLLPLSILEVCEHY